MWQASLYSLDYHLYHPDYHLYHPAPRSVVDRSLTPMKESFEFFVTLIV